jgi:DNA-binding Lrp family transcriptional regulator
MPSSSVSSVQFNDLERAILREAQGDLPDSLTPYADIAARVGADEDTVLNLLRRLASTGAIRRFGASIRHHKAGWAHNAMVAWKVPEEEADNAGKQAAKHERISHCYFRPTSAPDWPYTLYTMIHGKDTGDCQCVIEELKEQGLNYEYAVLESLRELKKSSMKYFI